MLARKDLTFATLVDKMNLSDATLACLHNLQPNAKAWIEVGKVTLEDCEVMHKFWDIHPTRDFYVHDNSGVHDVKIGEILQAGLSYEALKGCGVTLEELARAGLNPDNMRLFHFTLYQWRQLGFNQQHAGCMSDAQVETVFGMPRHVMDAAFVE